MAEVSIADFEADMIGGKKLKLSKYRGKVLLIVNTASRCGFTPQFAGLEKLWQAYRERGLVVLGFPSNEFGGQDPGSNEDIAEFCEVNYGVSFPMMGKVEVNGAGAHPLFQWLTRAAPGLLGSQVLRKSAPTFSPPDEPTVWIVATRPAAIAGWSAPSSRACTWARAAASPSIGR